MRYILPAFVFLIVWRASIATDIDVTVAKQKDEMSKFLKSHLIAVAKSSQKARFVTDGKIWQKEIELSKGERLNSQPDHHGSFFYEVKNVDDNRVVLKYGTRFDHRSFGKDLITVDNGEFAIGYGNFTALQPAAAADSPPLNR